MKTINDAVRTIARSRRLWLTIAGLVLASHAGNSQTWIPSGSPPKIPFDAIAGGTNPFGMTYLCRGGQSQGYGTQLGNYSPYSGVNGCDIGFGGREIVVTNFEFVVPTWQPASNGAVPLGADYLGLAGFGQEADPARTPLVICRAKIQGSLQPGKVRPGFDGCYVPFAGKEVHVAQYEVLVESGQNPWQSFPYAFASASNGYIPPDAIRGGTDGDGTPLYLCSASWGGGWHPGKLRQDFRACDFSFGGEEHFVSNYKVLVADWAHYSSYYYMWLDYGPGTDVDASSLQVCRANYHGLKIPGKTRLAFGNTCHFALNGVEQETSDYDLLTNRTHI